MERFHFDKIMDDVQSAMKDLSVELGDLGLGASSWGPEADQEVESGPGETIEQQFDVGPTPLLSVSNVSGRIIIRADGGSTIRVRATKGGSSRARATTSMDIHREGNRVSIQTKGDPGGLLGFARHVSRVDYDIAVPFGCEVQAKAVSAEVRIERTRAPLQAETVSGDLTLSDITGECRVTTVSGDVSVHGLEGVLILRTTSGDVTVTHSRLNHFNLNSVSGDFVVETPLTNGQHYLARTVSGDLQILVPPGTGATISMKSVSGDVSSDLPAEIIKSGRRHWQGRINGGGANVEVNSVSGDLRFAHSSRSDVAGPTSTPNQSPSLSPNPVPAPSVPPTPPAPADATPVQEAEPAEQASDGQQGAESETSAVLGALERGEITVEEAMARLDALR